MYLPLIGIFICAFKFVEDFIEGRNLVFKKALVVLLIIYFGFFSIATILRNREWRDSIVFYNQILKYNKTYRIYNNLGNAYMDIGEYKKSEESYKAAVAIDPSFPQPEAYNNLGLLYSKQGKDKEAVDYYQKALEIKENYLPTIANLGELYQRKKDWDSAKKYYAKYAELVPYNPFGYFKLGEVSFLEGKCADALKYLEEAKKIAPQDDRAVQDSLSSLIVESKKCIK
jgi:tetratricopeptide (TPR) repeat protein